MGTSTWTFGIRPLPIQLEGVAASMLVWTADDLIVHVEIEENHAITDASIAAAFEKAVSAPASGVALGRPKKIIVESGAVAKRVRPLFRGARIEIGSTSDIDDAVAAYLDDTEAVNAQDEASFLATPEAWKPELLRIGRTLGDCAPWEVFPPDQPLECVAPSVGLDSGRVVIIGHIEESYGFLVFRSAAEHAAFEAHALGGELAANTVLPRFVGVDIAELELEPDGEPQDVAIVTVIEGRARVTPTDADLRLAVAVADALVAFVREHEETFDDDDAWERGIVGQYGIDVLGTVIPVGLTARDAEDDPSEE